MPAVKAKYIFISEKHCSSGTHRCREHQSNNNSAKGEHNKNTSRDTPYLTNNSCVGRKHMGSLKGAYMKVYAYRLTDVVLCAENVSNASVQSIHLRLRSTHALHSLHSWAVALVDTVVALRKHRFGILICNAVMEPKPCMLLISAQSRRECQQFSATQRS